MPDRLTKEQMKRAEAAQAQSSDPAAFWESGEYKKHIGPSTNSGSQAAPPIPGVIQQKPGVFDNVKRNVGQFLKRPVVGTAADAGQAVAGSAQRAFSSITEGAKALNDQVLAPARNAVADFTIGATGGEIPQRPDPNIALTGTARGNGAFTADTGEGAAQLEEIERGNIPTTNFRSAADIRAAADQLRADRIQRQDDREVEKLRRDAKAVPSLDQSLGSFFGTAGRRNNAQRALAQRNDDERNQILRDQGEQQSADRRLKLLADNQPEARKESDIRAARKESREALGRQVTAMFERNPSLIESYGSSESLIADAEATIQSQPKQLADAGIPLDLADWNPQHIALFMQGIQNRKFNRPEGFFTNKVDNSKTFSLGRGDGVKE